MEWMEAVPLPFECRHCQEDDCYNCDHAGKRWYLSELDALKVRRKRLLKAVERLQQKIDAIDRRLAEVNDLEDEPNVPMTQELWEHCLSVCIQDSDMEQYNKLWNEYPEFAANMMHEFDTVAIQTGSHATEEEKRVSWEQFVERMRAEYGADFL